MSQTKQNKPKTLLSFCSPDFLKFTKQTFLTLKKTKGNKNIVHTAVSNTVENDKDKIIQKLNKRISELEERIRKLESQQKKNNKRCNNIMLTEPSPHKKKFISLSNSSKKLFDNRLIKKETSNLIKSHIDIMNNIKSKSKNLSFDNSKSNYKRTNGVEYSNKKSVVKRNNCLKTETTFDITSTSSITNTTSNITTSNYSTKNIQKIKNIPKIPKSSNELMFYKNQFDMIKTRTKNIMQRLIENK